MFRLFRKMNNHEREVTEIKGEISREVKKTVSMVAKTNKKIEKTPTYFILKGMGTIR